MFVVSQYALENEELTQHLGAAKDAQRALTSEVTQTQLSLFKLYTQNHFSLMASYNNEGQIRVCIVWLVLNCQSVTD